ncbi:glutaminase [Flammeovirgaceae bacterium SG7u.111]|nr:glutaminase [Flammeovirgaceae bacterium SG7u.132]WPO36567.1 glutaminase [Flammeovirgaceae bacterium SG7u.111]
MNETINSILEEIHQEVLPFLGTGKVVDYIPILNEADPNKFGMTLISNDRRIYSVGNAQELFSIQSVSKVLTLTLAMQLGEEKLWKRVGREPSGNRFNSLVQLEHENGKPRNPFINAGALVVTDMLISALDDPKAEILDFVRKVSCNSTLEYNFEIAQAEKEMGFTNAALVNFMKSFKNIENDVEEVLDTYFHHCSIMLNTEDLARSFMMLSNQGNMNFCNEQIISKRQSKRINSIMATSGFYDQAGEFAYRVGLPGKSGVSGAIAAVYPGDFSVAVWSPELNSNGNSVLGIEALDRLTTKLELSIY